MARITDRITDPFRRASRATYADKGQPSLVELHPMIEYKAAWKDRTEKLERKRQAKADRKAEERRGDLLRAGRLIEVKPSTRRVRRFQARWDASQKRKGQRAYDRQVATRARMENTAANQARALAGDFGPQMQANVQVIVDREEARRASA